MLSIPFALRYLFATRPATLSQVLAIVYRVIARRYAGTAGVAISKGHTGSVTLIQRFRGQQEKGPAASCGRARRFAVRSCGAPQKPSAGGSG